MLSNYFTIAYRKFIRNKLHAVVNGLSLVTGITSCILIGLYILHETGVDRFHENANRIVRVTMEYAIDGTVNSAAFTGTKVGPHFAETFPEVENFVRTFKTSKVVKLDESIFDESRFLYADSSFFSIFSFPLKSGDPKSVLNGPDKIVISEDAAKRYFGNENPVGKILTVGTDQSFVITGVAHDPPKNSQVQFDFVAPFSSLKKNEEWFTANYITYLLLHEQSQIDILQQKVTAYLKDVSSNELEMKGGNYLTHHLEPLKRVHLYSPLEGFEPNGNITRIYVLGSIALLILLIACINYTNLTTAQAMHRTREIGLRKVVGAQKHQLLLQMLGESAFLTLLCLAVAILLVIQLIPFCNQIAGTHLTLDLLWQPVPLASLLLLLVLVVFASAAYPGYLLSRFTLVDIIKSKVRLPFSSGFSGKSLIILQFTISVFLIIATLVIWQQLEFIQQKDLGYNKEHVVVLPVDGAMRKNYDALKEAVARDQRVISVSGGYESPASIGWGDGITVNEKGIEKQISVNALPVDLDFLETMGIKVIEGSDFTPADLSKQDTSNNYQNYQATFILNEAAVKLLNWQPQDAVGKTISKGIPGTVKGVIRDFHFTSLHQPIGPLVIFLDKGMVNQLFIKLSGKDIKPALQSLQSLWKERVPHRPFEYHFLDQEYDALYKTEQRMAQIFGTFALVAIVLACLGLFALAAFATAQRTKEIGIRKVLGASVASVTALLSRDFVKLIAIAQVMAIPASLFAMERWLQDFAYRIPVTGWVLALGGCITVLVALAAISLQTIKAATANPVKSLRAE